MLHHKSTEWKTEGFRRFFSLCIQNRKSIHKTFLFKADGSVNEVSYTCNISHSDRFTHFFCFHSVITYNDALPKKRVASMLAKFRQHKHELDEVRHRMSVLERKKQTEGSQQSKKKKIDKRKKAKQARK